MLCVWIMDSLIREMSDQNNNFYQKKKLVSSKVIKPDENNKMFDNFKQFILCYESILDIVVDEMHRCDFTNIRMKFTFNSFFRYKII